MRHTQPDPHLPHPARRTALIATAVLALLLLAAAGVGVYGLVAEREPADTPTPAATATTQAPPTPSIDTRPQSAEVFARLVAVTLFDWDTGVDTPGQIRDRLLGWADPSGEETNGLVADLDAWLPDDTTWTTLRGYHTTQRLDIYSAAVPDSWPGIVASAPPGQLPPGALAYTITGTRRRDGLAYGQATSIARPVAFTMFLACTPIDCHLLRLGRPDQPLR